MRETSADTKQAVVLSLLLHLVPLTLLLLSPLWRLPAPTAAGGQPISADVVDRNALSASMRRALSRAPEPLPEPPPEAPPEQALPDQPPPEPLQEPLPDPLPEEPPPQQLEAQESIPEPDETQQQEVRADSAAAETAEREQEAQRKQGQRDLTERERQEDMEQRRMTEMERQRQQQLADIRRQRAAASRDAQLAEERLRQIAERNARQASEAAATQPPGEGGVDQNLKAAYSEAIADAIRRNWVRPDNVPANQVCRIVIRQIPGGQVIDAQVDPSCPYDELGRRSVEAAVLKAQPLPYSGFERVFDRTLILRFRAEDP
jgi:colicin import membrane protein